MTKSQELNLLKLVAVMAAGFYLYRLAKSQGKSLQGQVNTEKIAVLASKLFPKEYRSNVQMAGSHILKRIIQ